MHPALWLICFAMHVVTPALGQSTEPETPSTSDDTTYFWSTWILLATFLLFYSMLVAAIFPYARPRFSFLLIALLVLSPPFFFFFVLYLLFTVTLVPRVVVVERPSSLRSRSDVRNQV